MPWKEHERAVQEALGLDATVNSGNQFHDPGDAADRRHPSEAGGILILADAKCTTRKSYSLRRDDMKHWCSRAREHGKVGVLPIRFEDLPSPRRPSDPVQSEDYVVLELTDFAEMLFRATHRPDVTGAVPPVALFDAEADQTILDGIQALTDPETRSRVTDAYASVRQALAL